MEDIKRQNSLLVKISVLVGILIFGLLGAASGPLFANAEQEAPPPSESFATQNLPADVSPSEETVSLTQTVNATKLNTVTVSTVVQKTVIVTSGYTPIFNRPSPEIPHAYNLYIQHTGDGLYDEDGTAECFGDGCHVVRVEHKFWTCDADACASCHKVTPTPTITPPSVIPIYTR